METHVLCMKLYSNRNCFNHRMIKPLLHNTLLNIVKVDICSDYFLNPRGQLNKSICITIYTLAKPGLYCYPHRH